MSNKKTRAEKREILAQKEKIKKKSGGTLAGQVTRTQTTRQYTGKKNKSQT